MSWKKHLKVVPQGEKMGAMMRQMAARQQNSATSGTNSNFQSVLPEIYSGPPNRIERYTQYDNMYRDPVIRSAIGTIATFCTQQDENTGLHFDLNFVGESSESETSVLNESLRTWSNINKFKQRLWKLFCNTLIYGDQFYARDPDTFYLHWLNHENVEKVVVNEAAGKEPEMYVVKNLELYIQAMVMSPDKQKGREGITGWPNSSSNYNQGTVTQQTQYQSVFNTGADAKNIDANHVVHFSLSEGSDPNWPFGVSVLEPLFKVFKQKELLEDSIVIYRIIRAPERRVFYIDTGRAPAHIAMEMVNRIKQEFHQRRIPTQTGGGSNITDAAYNPQSMIEDFYFPQSADGKGSRVEVLPGGDNLGQIDDLRYFNNELIRGLQVPITYISFGSEENTSTYTDGRVGTAFIKEYEFAKYCKRLQNTLNPIFDREFKLFLKDRGIQVDSSSFFIELTEPQSFSAYRQIEMDSAYLQMFQQVSNVPYLSKRWLMKRYLGLTEAEIIENERMWSEENKEAVDETVGSMPNDSGGGLGLSSMGVKAEEPDIEDTGDELPDEAMPDFDEAVAEEPAAGGEEPDINL